MRIQAVPAKPCILKGFRGTEFPFGSLGALYKVSEMSESFGRRARSAKTQAEKYRGKQSITYITNTVFTDSATLSARRRIRHFSHCFQVQLYTRFYKISVFLTGSVQARNVDTCRPRRFPSGRPKFIDEAHIKKSRIPEGDGWYERRQARSHGNVPMAIHFVFGVIFLFLVDLQRRLSRLTWNVKPKEWFPCHPPLFYLFENFFRDLLAEL